MNVRSRSVCLHLRQPTSDLPVKHPLWYGLSPGRYVVLSICVPIHDVRTHDAASRHWSRAQHTCSLPSSGRAMMNELTSRHYSLWYRSVPRLIMLRPCYPGLYTPHNHCRHRKRVSLYPPCLCGKNHRLRVLPLFLSILQKYDNKMAKISSLNIDNYQLK